jgi:DNA helicase-2/ATP-dependent DNA helicase PcrA
MQANLHRGLSTRLALGGNFDFRPGVVVTSVTEVKGLEFDTVILPDADETTYPDTQEARRALYVAATRPLWQLWLLAGGKTSPLVENALGIDSGR